MFEWIHNRKGQIYFTKERRTIRQKSICLSHLNERFPGKHPDAGVDQ